MSEFIREALRNYIEEREWLRIDPLRETTRSPCRTGRFTMRCKEDSMKKKHLQPLTPAALYARVSSDRQDVDLSVSAQLQGAQRLRQSQRLLRRPGVRGRGRERPRG